MSSDPPASPRTAIITGGSGGIGRAVTQRLADDGLAVVAAYAGNRDRAESVVEEISATGGGTASAFRADVAEEADVAALFDHAEQLFGGVDVVVNTAGIMILKPLVDYDLEDFDRLHRANVRGAFLITREAARRTRRGGAIINFSSSVTKLALPSYSVYAASKGAVAAMTMVVARELRGRDITVNTVAPGPTATPLFLDGKDDATIEHLAQMAPLERLGTPEDIAETIAHLAGPARWINGQVIYVNGGIA
jgi:3-oxoacyl-[acyl-carrier protein] reductase